MDHTEAVNAILIDALDNVVTLLGNLEPGSAASWTGGAQIAQEAVSRGHKIAIRKIAAGEAVTKYGCTIGLASVDIAPGEHVHLHNLGKRT